MSILHLLLIGELWICARSFWGKAEAREHFEHKYQALHVLTTYKLHQQTTYSQTAVPTKLHIYITSQPGLCVHVWLPEIRPLKLFILNLLFHDAESLDLFLQIFNLVLLLDCLATHEQYVVYTWSNKTSMS